MSLEKNNPFDEQTKQSLEGFEMPYDAAAWSAFSQQLPLAGSTAGSATSGLGSKAAAILALVGISVATIWYMNGNESTQIIDSEIAASDIQTTETITIEGAQTEPIESTVESKITETTKSADLQEAQKSPTSIEEVAEKRLEQVKESNLNPVEAKPLREAEAPEPAEKISAKKPEVRLFSAKFLPSSNTVCVGEEISFINESSNPKAKMNWVFGDGQSSNSLNPSHSFQVPGIYTVKLSGKDGEQHDDYSSTIAVNPSPRADISPSEKLAGYKAIPFYHFETNLQPNETATWKFNDGLIQTGNEADHLFREAGKSIATLTVKNNSGCSTSSTWTLDNEKFNLLAYSGFSPDVNGLNETFMPPALPLMGIPFEMIVRDQKGQEVYRTSNPLEPWNGKLHNSGDKLAPGIYVWTVVLKENVLSKKDFNGTITIRP